MGNIFFSVKSMLIPENDELGSSGLAHSCLESVIIKKFVGDKEMAR